MALDATMILMVTLMMMTVMMTMMVFVDHNHNHESFDFKLLMLPPADTFKSAQSSRIRKTNSQLLLLLLSHSMVPAWLAKMSMAKSQAS